MTTRNIFQQQAEQIRSLQADNEKLRKEVEELKEQLKNQLTDNSAYAITIQSLYRGYNVRKELVCCVCYDRCFQKNNCCNSYLCGECSSHCNNKCPMCRGQLNDVTQITREENVVLRDFDRGYSIRSVGLQSVIVAPESRIRRLNYGDVPDSHRLHINNNYWAKDFLTLVRTYNIVDDEYFFDCIDNDQSIIIRPNMHWFREYIDSWISPADWTSKENSPRILRINGQGHLEQIDNTGERGLGSASGFKRYYGVALPDEYKGGSRQAKLNRGMLKIYRCMNYPHFDYNGVGTWSSIIIKYKNSTRMFIVNRV